MKIKKKMVSLSILSILLLICFFKPTVASADYYTATGSISWYPGEGKPGYNDKILTKRDCATRQYVDNPPANTVIYVKDNSNGHTGTFYKNDLGPFPPGVVLDITYGGWLTFGYSPSKGYFTGSYFHN